MVVYRGQGGTGCGCGTGGRCSWGRREGGGGQLADAIRTAVAGDTLLAPVITRRLIERFCRQPAPGEAPPQLASLTSRELQVLRLVGRGQPNTAIAGSLFIAETTVKTHVAHILTKLGLADRAQAVVLAYETGLVQPGENNNPLS